MARGLWPEDLMIVGALLSMVSVMLHDRRSIQGYWIALIAVLASAWATVGLAGSAPPHLFGNAVVVDGFSVVVNGLVLLAALTTLLLGWNDARYGAEFPPLVLVASVGMMVLGLANSFIVLFLGIELLSLPLYILAALRETPAGKEAALKYLLLGAFSSGIMLFGLALLYGASGTLVFTALNLTATALPLVAAGLALTLVGLLFKLGIVPFHMWLPDVYEGSPTPVTSFMAFGTKVGAAAILLRFLMLGFAQAPGWWSPALGYLAVLTMVVGNLLAIPQNDLKRLLAYSGIGNAGYILMGPAAHSTLGTAAALFYLLPYGLAAVGAFSVVQMVGQGDQGVTMKDVEGLAYRSPWLYAGLSVALLSLAGIPLTGGFVGKFYLVQASLMADQPGIAIGLAVATMIGLVAYLRPIQAGLRRSSEASSRVSLPIGAAIVLTVAVLGTIGLGVYPAPIVHIVNHSAQFMGLP
ncbi:proton-translocating NADH-quinone oxidoreductase, chain N [Sulfobacillus acidophilus TPY]|uniref:NADH-quinone oxidoreductase subunit N n=1 Tax=Sulfobacillus acidophilus (strain ATCC 700253 / DSM 10332 / NAL) TaxID=679936 RepID=G8TYH5_SULAD|nr:proton-translocating NADH-quinone oxidoreductase, chain N [Sulfobacillus acidophilus TPY]AEW06236.1 NADH dehydrogenase subunit N [Sulfobacillus acidophilus DSM 10332]